MNRPFSFDRYPLRVVALAFALFVYGLFGSATPVAFGLTEVVVAAGLALAIGPLRAFKAVILPPKARWALAGQGLFFYGISVPLIIGLASGHDPSLIIRDLIPFGFFLLPLLLGGWRQDAQAVKWLMTCAVAFIGVAFGARVLIPVLINGAGVFVGSGADPLYLSIAPTVVFAAVFVSGIGGYQVYRSVGLRAIFRALILCGLAVMPMGATAVTLQRASLGLIALALAFLFAVAVAHRPARMAGPALLAICVLILMWPIVGEVAAELLHKQNIVGSNMRFEEATVVFNLVGASPWSVLFGKGWGATLADPAVGGAVVNYTHNLLTTYWLKTGLVGLSLVVVYVGGLGMSLCKLVWTRPVIAVGLAVPLIIDSIFYATFKSLDFGLVLFLISLWSAPSPAVRQADAPVAPDPGLVYP